MCHLGRRHGLQANLAGAGDHSVKQTLAAEEHILHALDHLHIHGAGGVHHGHHAGIADDLLAGLQDVFGAVAIQFKEGQTGACDLLHDEPLAAEEAGTKFLLQVNGKLHTVSRAEESGFLADDALAGAQFPGDEDLMHQKNECLSIERLEQMTKIYAEAIYKLSSGEYNI